MRAVVCADSDVVALIAVTLRGAGVDVVASTAALIEAVGMAGGLAVDVLVVDLLLRDVAHLDSLDALRRACRDVCAVVPIRHPGDDVIDLRDDGLVPITGLGAVVAGLARPPATER